MDKDNLFIYQLQPEDEGKRFENLLARRFHFSRKVLQKIKIGQNVWVDGKFVYLNTRGQAGQTLVVKVSEDEDSTIVGENLPIDIIYEDSLFLAVNKPPGQVVHPNSLYKSGTLANAVVGYWESKGESRPFRPVSRIDRNTSGIVLIAKSRYAHQQLARVSVKNQVEKKYLGVVGGSFPLDKGVFDSPIGVQPGSKIVREIHPQGQLALTLFETIQRFSDYTLMMFILITGRTHQIRVHCQHSGYPLLGDELYGGDMRYIARQALHCHSYSFVNPLSGKNITIKAPLPEDMQSLLDV
ncbi:MAG: RNA pseudouridine synthase [Gracilibacter sp. BRH_c7a]|nr:MAG: RNA pseudouridine synthase [Gracilibacter sp. BRH_c7a]